MAYRVWRLDGKGIETSGPARSVSKRLATFFWWLCVGDLRVCRFVPFPVRQPAYSCHPLFGDNEWQVTSLHLKAITHE
jgi:hypothetical protein